MRGVDPHVWRTPANRGDEGEWSMWELIHLSPVSEPHCFFLGEGQDSCSRSESMTSQWAQPLRGCWPDRHSHHARLHHASHSCSNIAGNLLWICTFKAQDGFLLLPLPGLLWQRQAAGWAELLHLWLLDCRVSEEMISSLKGKDFLMKWRSEPPYIAVRSSPSAKLDHHWFV